MKLAVLLLVSQFFAACVLAPRPTQPLRKSPSSISDLDNLEMLLLNEQESLYANNTRLLSHSERVRLGMQRKRVQMTLGHPAQIEVAGNPKYGNERWTYERSVPTLQGYYTERQVIYFESGSVVGWESE